ncbi:N-acetylgalactosamine-6-sulfatase [Adhaeribacter aerolatus]|uniref:N-acetylgalactosamine-6-sulfatase n=1 Tax=Adhaeribacter aerolatus TaxID=670289 RepID=A0A512AUU8_9BACT|nr:N-acetylgalactosamine-6-sulfatase [Adhaeribacter aerolatus]
MLVLLVLSTAGRAAAPKPNIIIINVDDLGWSDLGCYGSDYYETKHIDRLAREGVRFTKAYAAAAICSPTRAALLTGKYPARVGITDWIRAEFQGGVVPPSGKNPTEYVTQAGKSLKTPPNPLFMELAQMTSAEYLQKQGYATCHVGKWHLGPEQWYPTSQGFNINIAGSDLGQPPSYFDPYVNNNKGKSYNIPTLAPRKEGEFLTDRLGDEVVTFVQQHAGKPFFISWNPYAVHTPIQGKKEYIEKYRQKQGGNHKNPVYAALIQSLDDNVGKLVRCLDSLKLTQNTLLIFTSDNGGLLPITSNLPLRSGKGYPYEGGLRVPLIVKWPGVAKAGSLIDEPTISMDVFATVMDAAGVGKTSSDGLSLLPLLRNANQHFNRDLFWHFPHYRETDVVPYSIIRSGNYKLIKYYDGTKNELYNLAKDPTEKTNLYETSNKEANRLESSLSNWLKKVNAKIPENTTAKRQ